MTTMSQEVPETPPIEDRELGATIAPSMPNVESMPHRQDKNTDAGTGETIEHTRDSWPKESPKKPTMGNTGIREPPRTSECMLPTVNTNKEFYMVMTAILDKYMKGTFQKINE